MRYLFILKKYMGDILNENIKIINIEPVWIDLYLVYLDLSTGISTC